MYKKIAELMKKNNVTAYKVAKATGISNSAFTSWKNERCKPNVEALQKLAEYFGVSVDYFLSDVA